MGNKNILRQEMKRKRAEAAKSPAKEALLANAKEQLNKIIQPEQIVAAYYPINDEPDVLICLDGCQLALPRIEGDILQFKKYKKGDELVKHPTLPIMEPAQDQDSIKPDIIIVPLLAFDKQRNRLGYGGGYYDRTLLHYPDAHKIGIAYACQRVETLPAEEHDIKLDTIIT